MEAIRSDLSAQTPQGYYDDCNRFFDEMWANKGLKGRKKEARQRWLRLTAQERTLCLFDFQTFVNKLLV